MFQRRIPEHKLRLPAPTKPCLGAAARFLHKPYPLRAGTPCQPPYPAGMQQIVLGNGLFLGCRAAAVLENSCVYTTAVGYTGVCCA